MQTKLTLRMEEALVRKAKLLAQQRGTSVSRVFGDYISNHTAELPSQELPPITASMLGVIAQKGATPDESNYLKYLEERHL